MTIHWKELNQFFINPLPAPDEAVAKLNGISCEIESVVVLGDDWILDVKILPDRNDAKTLDGFARELSAVMSWPMKDGVSVIANKESARIKVEFSPAKINEILGLQLSDAEITALLNRVRVGTEKSNGTWLAYVPADRADINITEDLADEVMRLYGIGSIPLVALTALSPVALSSIYETAQKARTILVSLGYTEIYNYSFSAAGEREVEKSLASHKSFLRSNLSDALRETLLFHCGHMLFEHESVKLFEIGTIFLKEKEELRLAVGIIYTKDKYVKEKLPDWLMFGVKLPSTSDGSLTPNTVEMPLEKLLPALEKMENPDPTPYLHLDRTFKPFSLYPRIIRDIALFVPIGVKSVEVEAVIRGSAGPLLAEGPVKFDEFSKEGESRSSLAFRIALQSTEKSLTDEEAHTVVSRIISALEKHPNWEVRK